MNEVFFRPNVASKAKAEIVTSSPLKRSITNMRRERERRKNSLSYIFSSNLGLVQLSQETFVGNATRVNSKRVKAVTPN